MIAEPKSNIGVCKIEVYKTDFIPPKMVYKAVIKTNPIAAIQKKSIPHSFSIPNTS